MVSFLYFTTIALFILMCIVLCFVILIQESKSGGGLGASFGGAASESLFGTSTADVLKTFTGWLSIAFFAMCIILSLWTAAMGRGKQVESTGFSTELTN